MKIEDAKEKSFEKTRAIIKKWYESLNFPKEYDVDFYTYVEKYDISEDVDISTYDLKEKDGRRNLFSFLYMCEKLSEKYKEKGIDRQILVNTVRDIVLWTKAWSDVEGEMYLGELEWLSNHFNMKLFRLGSLEYMLKKFPDGLSEFGITKDEYLLDVHIPNDAKFSPADCEESFKMAKEFFAKHYPEIKLRFFTCESWLLDRELEKLLPETSNILGFGRRFAVVPHMVHENFAALRYVFKWNTNVSNLENAVCTSGFSKRLKQHVLNGGKLYEVTGVFPFEAVK